MVLYSTMLQTDLMMILLCIVLFIYNRSKFSNQSSSVGEKQGIHF